MEVTDFTNRTNRGALQIFRKSIARAVTKSQTPIAKQNWLNSIFTTAIISLGNDEDGTVWEATRPNDTSSYQAEPMMIKLISQAISRSKEFAPDYKVQVIDDLSDAQQATAGQGNQV